MEVCLGCMEVSIEVSVEVYLNNIEVCVLSNVEVCLLSCDSISRNVSPSHSFVSQSICRGMSHFVSFFTLDDLSHAKCRRV